MVRPTCGSSERPAAGTVAGRLGESTQTAAGTPGGFPGGKASVPEAGVPSPRLFRFPLNAPPFPLSPISFPGCYPLLPRGRYRAASLLERGVGKNAGHVQCSAKCSANPYILQTFFAHLLVQRRCPENLNTKGCRPLPSGALSSSEMVRAHQKS